MENIKQEDLIEQDAPTSEVIEQDPLKEELEKVQRTTKTEEEKAAFTLQKTAERLTALGQDPAKILGFSKEAEPTDDDAPITLGMWKQLQAQEASKTAVQMADDIANDTERELVKYHLNNTIRSTGNPAKDLELASSIVNAAKNRQVIEELARKPVAKSFSSNGGAGAPTEQEPPFTEEEKQMMKAFKLTPAEVYKARKG